MSPTAAARTSKASAPSLRDRLKDVIIIRGANHYPQDIEWEASQAEGVRKGNVVAFGSAKYLGSPKPMVNALARLGECLLEAGRDSFEDDPKDLGVSHG
jgi:acyl-CoA synthetase (AMP-forming)/AMP-acid ligase II